MIGEAIRERTEFGIVLAREDGIVDTGCTVTVEKVVNTYPDGRMDIMAHGARRFEIVSLDQEKPFLRAEVEFFDDDEPGPAGQEVREQVLTQYRELLDVLESPLPTEMLLEDAHLSFLLAQPVNDVEFLQQLLASRSEEERLRRLASFLSEYIPRQRRITRVRHVAPLNGHGVPPSGI